jgi:OmpA-OmpF porin, OOP family
MSFNLLDLVKGHFNNDLINKAASLFGENESGISKAISGIVPSVLSGIVSKATSGGNGAEEVLSAAKQTSGGGLFSNLTGLLGNADLLNKGGDLLTSFFGDKANGIISTIAGFAGIKNSTASSLMSMAAPAAMSTIGKHATDNNLSAGGLMDLLSSQKSTIMSALPAGLSSITNLFGGSKVAEVVSSANHNVKAASSQAHEYIEKKSGGSWLLPLLLLAAASILAWWFLLGGKQGCSSKKAGDSDTAAAHADSNHGGDHSATNGTVSTSVATGKIDTISGDFVYNLGKTISIDLPNNGGKLEVGENSTEAKLVAFLNDASKTVDTVKGNWFEFTNVRFKTGSSVITDESLAQLKNMVAIAKAYPTATFKLGGYTDNTGDSVKNVTLSQKRADAVVTKLKELGATVASIVSAKGYGPQWPIGDNGTAEGKAMNRRVAVNVKSK